MLSLSILMLSLSNLMLSLSKHDAAGCAPAPRAQ